MILLFVDIIIIITPDLSQLCCLLLHIFLFFYFFLIPNFFIISFLQFLFKFIKIKNWIFFHLKFSRILVLGFDLLTFNPPSPPPPSK